MLMTWTDLSHGVGKDTWGSARPTKNCMALRFVRDIRYYLETTVTNHGFCAFEAGGLYV